MTAPTLPTPPIAPPLVPAPFVLFSPSCPVVFLLAQDAFHWWRRLIHTNLIAEGHRGCLVVYRNGFEVSNWRMFPLVLHQPARRRNWN